MRAPVYHRMFGYDLNLLPNRHLASLEAGVTNVEQARQRTGATIGYPGWGFIYHLLLSHLDRSKDEVIVETGTNEGCTTIILAQALIDSGVSGHIHSFELEADNVRKAKANLDAASLSGVVTIHEGDVHNTLPMIAASLQNIRFAFLDASHLLRDVMFEFETILPCLADDAIVLFDNTYCIAEPGEDQRVNGALKMLQNEHGGNLINLEHVSWFTPGLALWQRIPKL